MKGKIMRTGILTLQEARTALLEGYITQNDSGSQWRWLLGMEMQFRSNQKGNWAVSTGGPCDINAEYSIVKPEPKTLSFDEAASANFKGVRYEVGIPYTLFGPWRTGPLDNLDSLFLLDLAERRGWPITEVVE